MSIPISRVEFKEFCLRKLGKPVIQINVSDEQVDDRVDEALKYYWDYHFDGTEKMYYKHQVTSTDKTNRYITLPANIMGAVRVFPISDPSVRSDDMFNIRYQMALNDLYSLTSTSLVPYYLAMEHLALITELLVGQQPIRFSRHRNRLYVDMDWEKFNVGEYLLVEAYEVLDPDTYTDAWSDRWLANYCTSLIKQQWGSNLTKYKDVPLPGGVTFNAAQIKQEADQEIAKLEDEMLTKYSLPPQDYYG